ncbi:hypothetical protein SAMN05421788_11878 [Filimonas lacunae]|uniref:Uncharacterized protein n=1 Tax=Filimonas lacunae TaxID=477680 RepID=A0A173MB58_9BACT|nr:YkgJ family cysteine cluster protein [Filimonas lacunae]BAV04803.1 hypothetical protein FLA_0802 [Filimonas lacunae]SIT34747.1 hypothetical protein SAMN05421788_11878 [Filimonas lacunae]
MKLTHQLNVIEQAGTEKEAENYQFRQFLYQQNSADIDVIVHELDAAITPQVDCTACGNCCQSLMINVTPVENERLASHLQMPVAEFTQQYIETSLQGDMIVNTIPCHFLQNKCCTVYEYRFQECRTFPGLHLPDFTGRLFSTFMHYGRCPIIYNVTEQLKQRLQWQYQPADTDS